MPSLPTHHITQTLIGLMLWLWWTASAFAYSNPYPAGEFATACKPADNQKLGWAYIYDETGTLLGEYGMGGAASSGSTEHIYLPTAQGPLPVAAIINGQHYAVHTDHLNTPRRLTAANNQAVWQWAYSAFGQEPATTAAKRFTSANTVPNTGTTTTQPVAYHQRYPGQSYDTESGLHYNYFRSYDPQTGRYTQADPIGLSGGWNRYAYVGGNPLGSIDPLGLMTLESWWNASVAGFQSESLGSAVMRTLEGWPVGASMVGGLGRYVTAFSSAPVTSAAPQVFDAGMCAVKGLGNQNPLYKVAVQQFKATDLSNAGRALTKHPEVIGQTKDTLRQSLRTDGGINDAAHTALRDIMRNGVTTTPTLGRYGTVTQTQVPGGFGARWASDGSFIGFINP